jgi:ABC-type sugar transport system ATPase subunit
MNLFEGGSITAGALALDGYSIPLPRLISSLVQDGQPVTLGIRQEAVAVSAEPASTDGVHLPGEVEACESDFVHRMQTVHLHTGRYRYSGLCPLDVKLQIGQRAYATLDREHLHFFDTRTGLRI